jgi:hypothetical protein
MKMGVLMFQLTAVAIFIQIALGGLLTFGFINVALHIVAGLIVFFLVLATMVAAIVSKPSFKPAIAVSIVMVVLLIVQIILGFDALDTNNSAISWLHFVNSILIYGAAIVGVFLSFRWGTMPEGASVTILGEEQRKSTRTVVTVLQFMVGALVTMGGSLFAIYAVNSFGTSLGLIHFSIGITNLLAGIAYLRAIRWSRNFLLVINAVTIGYSSFSESIVQIQSLLPSTPSTGSLIGTIIAIIMSCVIIYLLLKRNH